MAIIVEGTRLASLTRLERPYMIIGEGPYDVVFLREFVKARNLVEADFHIVCPTKPDPTGKSGFKNVLENLGNFVGNGLERLQVVIIIGDKDTDANNAFKLLTEQIKKAGHLAVPKNPDDVVGPAEPGYPKTVIHLLPDHLPTGQLEDACLPAAYAARGDLKRPLDGYCGNVVNQTWSQNRETKMRLRVLMASHYEKPNAGFANIWQASPGPLIPLSHNSFKNLKAFLDGIKAQH